MNWVFLIGFVLPALGFVGIAAWLTLSDPDKRIPPR